MYSTERLKVIRGPMRERRQYLDRARGRALAGLPAGPAGLRARGPAAQRRARAGGRGPRGVGRAPRRRWGRRLRHRRGGLRGAAPRRPGASVPSGGRDVRRRPRPRRRSPEGEDGEQRRLPDELASRAARDERRARRTLVGPHRDEVPSPWTARTPAAAASSGQARSLLLALSLATLEVYRQEHGHAGGGAPRRPRFRAGRGARGRAVHGGGAAGPGPGDHRPPAAGPERLREAGRRLRGRAGRGARGMRRSQNG